MSDVHSSPRFFDRLLSKRNLKICPTPLWKLKLTEREYEELRGLLAADAGNLDSNPFRRHNREACLFYAEFWNREYKAGSHSMKMVFDALQARMRRLDVKYEEAFYEAAKEGARILGIETFPDATRTLDDMLYQGGLPLGSLFSLGSYSPRWDAFMKGLVFRRLDFDQLDIGQVAASNKGLREYCRTLSDAIDRKQFRLLPFHCESEADPRYLLLLKEFSVQRDRSTKPFSIDWEFRLNTLDEKMSVYYIVNGRQELTEGFLKQAGGSRTKGTRVHVECNSIPVDSFDFDEDGFCRYEVRSRHLYHDGDEISLVVNESAEALMSDSIDLTMPHVMYRAETGRYFLGNRIGRYPSAILVPEGWSVEEEEIYSMKTYRWDGNAYKALILPEDWSAEVRLTSPDGRLAFGSGSVLCWTELATPREHQPLVRESVFNGGNAKFKLCQDVEDGGTSTISLGGARFRNKWSREWTETPSYGEIYAKADSRGDGFVTPVKFINVGNGLSITVVSAQRDSCRIKVVWPHGSVSTRCGTLTDDGIWEIYRSDCHDPRNIPFVFTPSDSRNTFTLTVKAPFKEFSITDEDGRELVGENWVPYDALDRYRYNIVGVDIPIFNVGNKKYSLIWMDEQLRRQKRRHQGSRGIDIPYSGSLLQLLGDWEAIRSSLGHTAEDMIKAEVMVEFRIPTREPLILHIKRSPYEVRQVGNATSICVKDHINNIERPIDYRGDLRLYK